MTVYEYLNALESDLRAFYDKVRHLGRYQDSDEVFDAMSQTSSDHTGKLERFYIGQSKPEKPDEAVYAFLRARIKHNLVKEIDSAPDRDESMHILMRTKEDVAGAYISIAEYYTELADYYNNLSEELRKISKEQIDSRDFAMEKMKSLHITSTEDFPMDLG